MVKSHSRQASEATRLPIVGPTNEELLDRLMENEWRDDLLDDLGDRDELMKRLFDLALDSLRRTNAAASRMVDESVASRRDFDAWLAGMETSQQETRAMIEGLVNGR